MSDEFVVMYQESKSLPKDALQYVLKKEMEMVALFENIFSLAWSWGNFASNKTTFKLAAHHIVVQGQMWAFRRWALQKNIFTIEKYIEIQTDQIFKGLWEQGIFTKKEGVFNYMATIEVYKPKHHVRMVTASSLFDGHDASINIMRRILQASGAEVIHLGHNRSVEEVVNAAIQENVQAIAMSSYQGGHVEYFKYMHDLLQGKRRTAYSHLRRRGRRYHSERN